MDEIRKVSVIGAGTMGSGIAHVFAINGYEVNLIDTSDALLERALSSITDNLGRQVRKEIISRDEVENALKSINLSTDMDIAADSQLLIEAVFENSEVKKKVFGELERISDRKAILATNTSSISVTDIASATNRKDKVIGMHFFNPVPVMELVEIIKGESTGEETYQAVRKVVKSLGKTPVEVNDSPGFISNRVLMPMINEAVFALMEGVSSADDIDTVMKLGMNHPMGPLALADLIGLDVCLDILEVLHRDLGEDRYRPSPLLRKMVQAGRLGRKAKRGFYPYD
ncbi:MAG: 3-hydroxybutyryl-CoA dehydrogenase [Candidatus Marinimicrobia bacterium]|nr:3-hydroxybutyryl-CoA dehydrogenase [Candidatus Neomarinimicrobiota bacterium]